MYTRFNDHKETIACSLLGIFFLIQGLFILINYKGITTPESASSDKVKNVFDFINIFFIELRNILGVVFQHSPLITILTGVILVALGGLMFKFARVMNRTTYYDRRFIVFFFSLTFLMFIWTTVLMSNVYGWTSILFLVAFIVHMIYNVFNEYFDKKYRKAHYLVILFFYAVAYFFTQNSVYNNIDSGLRPTDVLSINMYFTMTWILGLLSLSVGVFLSKSENILKRPVKEEKNEMSRVESRRKLKFDVDVNKYFKFMQPVYNFRDKIIQKFYDFFEIQPVKWIRVNYIELVLGILTLLVIFLEFNNRNNVVFEGLFKISNIKYMYEWFNLALTFVLALLYIVFTILNTVRNTAYNRQMIIIVALWLKVTTSLFITLFRDVELSIFILPLNFALVLLTTPLLLMSIFKTFRGEKDEEA